MAKIVSPFTLTFKSLKGQFIAKEKLIKSSLIVQKKSSDDRRKNDERERRVNYENTLEKTLKFIGRPIKKIGKKLGFLDSLKQFITSVLLGFFAIRLLKYLPQLTKIFSLMLKVGDFILDVSGKLLNGLVTFVDRGYHAADNARKLVRTLGGEKALNALDGATNQTNSLLNSIVIAGMLFSDFGGVGQSTGSAGGVLDAGKEFIEDKLKQEAVKGAAEQAAKQGIRSAIGPLGATGIILGAGLLSSALGEGAFQIKKFGKQLQGWTSGKSAEANQDKNPITRFLKKGFFGWLSATLGPSLWILNGVGTLFDIVGAPFRYGIELIRAAVMKLNDNRKGLEEQNKNLGKFDARVRDGIREHFSVLAPLFNLMGMKGFSQKLQTPGSFGSLYGEKAARDMGYYGGGMVIKKFAGGGYTRTVGNEDKVPIPRTFNQQLPGLNAGSSVGGQKMITKIFPYSGDDGVMNQYDYLTSSYSSLSGAGSFGFVAGITVKSLLGDRVTSKDYDVVSGSLSSVLMSGVSEENYSAYSQVYSILGSDGIEPIIKTQITKNLSDIFGRIESQLRIQLGLKEPEVVKTAEKNVECCPTEGSTGEIAAGEIPPEGKALLDAIAGSESGGYNSRFPSKTFSGFKDHPRIDEPIPWRPGLTSNAAGRYQFLSTTWDGLAKKLGLTDFSPANQDRAAWQLAIDAYGYGASGIIRDLQTNPLKVANKLSGTWTSLPGGAERNAATDGFVGRYRASVAKYQGQKGPTAAKISPSSPAANVSDCVCDPEVPSGDPGEVQAAGATAGGNISGYPVTSGYGMRKHPITGEMKKHGGLDIGAPSGKPIALNVEGVAGPPPQYEGGYGNFIDIQIPSLGNLYFRFAHMLKPPNYKPGQKIPAGKIFGYVGSTGASTGAHIHFEVNKALSGYGGDRDPMPYGKYISVGRQSGGPTLFGGIRLLHKGEYVIDKDSVDLFGGVPFLSMINNVENESQRAQKSSQLIQHLSKYTGRKIDQRPDVVVESAEDTIVMSPPTYIQSPSSGFGDEETPNYEQDMCYARG